MLLFCYGGLMDPTSVENIHDHQDTFVLERENHFSISFQVMTLEAEVAKLRSLIEELQLKLAESEKELVSFRRC